MLQSILEQWQVDCFCAVPVLEATTGWSGYVRNAGDEDMRYWMVAEKDVRGGTDSVSVLYVSSSWNTNSFIDRPLVASELGTSKMMRRRRASVVLPDELGPDRPIMRFRSVSLLLAMTWSSRMDSEGRLLNLRKEDRCILRSQLGEEGWCR